RSPRRRARRAACAGCSPRRPPLGSSRTSLTSTPTLRAGVRSVLGADGELRRAPADRKLEDEAAAARELVPHADEPVGLRDARGHDREPETGAVGLGREVGTEQPPPPLRRQPRAGV